MFFVVDRNKRRLRLLETALELEEGEDGAGEETEDNIIMMSTRAARRFGIRPQG